MKQRLSRKQVWRWLASAGPLLILLVLISHYLFAPAYGAQLGHRSLTMVANEVSVKTTYSLVFDLATAGPLGSISIQFCSNDPFVNDPCVAPAGLDASGATLSTQTGPTGFTVGAATNANTIILTRAAAAAPIGQASYTFDTVVNPSSVGSYYARVQTYVSSDASGPASDYGGIAFAITNGLSISAEVPPYLLFCSAITIGGYNCANQVGDYIDFGEFSTDHTNSGSSQFLVATNAAQGYAITSDGTTMTSGNNIIQALANGDVSRPGTDQFGFNLVPNTAPNVGATVSGPGTSLPTSAYGQANTYRFNPGDTLVSSTLPNDVRKFTVSYIANVPKAQAPGVYVSTVTYICLANF